jgi:ABC-2 type transport system ATP-binding protein
MAEKSKDVVLRVDKVSKDFILPHEKSNSIKSSVIGLFRSKDKNSEVQHVLKEVSFQVEKGEFFGILGRNGSGKSTLLKIISEIYQPTKGEVKHKGKLVPFIELGVGFNPELTGRENVYLNGALLGFSRKEIDEKYDDIVKFAELEEFMDQKLKNYSSGMQVRLAFSLAIRAEGDILVLDEVLAVGDTNFQQKCNDYFEKIKYESKTVILVTHNMDAVEKYCSRAMIIDNGHILQIGEPSRVAQKYSELNAGSSQDEDDIAEGVVDVKIVIDGENGPLRVIDSTQVKNVQFKLQLTSKEDLEDISFGFTIFSGAGIPIFATNSKLTDSPFSLQKGISKEMTLKMENIFSNGNYDIAIAIRRGDKEVLSSTRKTSAFSVFGRKHDFAITSPPYEISE